MKFHSKTRTQSKTIENGDISSIKNKKRDKCSKSQKSVELIPKELVNNLDYNFENALYNNSINISEKNKRKNKAHILSSSQLSGLYDEEISYNINNRNIHDTTSSSQYKKEYEIDMDSDFNLYKDNNTITKNSTQKEYWLEEKNRYIQELEKKIQKQENTINNLVKYKNKYEEKIKNKENINNNHSDNSNRVIHANFLNFSSLENDPNYDIANRKMVKRLNKEDIRNKTYNNFIADAKIINNRKNKNNSKDKYNDLYSKYLQLNNDFKYLNNNNEMNHIKNKFDKLKTDYNILKSTISEKNKIIEMQKNEINKIKNNNENSNTKIQYIVRDKENNEDKVVIKQLKQQVENFKKDLFLSQNMVNSLQSQIEKLHAKNNNIQKNYNTTGNKNLDETKKALDKYAFTLNDKNDINQNIYVPMTPAPDRIITYKDIFIKKNDNQQELINSLNNKNKLLAKVLAENNELRNKLKNFDSFLPQFTNIEKIEDSQEELNKKILNKYEEKFKYFNEYIKKIKAYITQIYDDIHNVLNKYTNNYENKLLSDKFIFDLYGLRKDYNTIKKIDCYNLDITDDEKCIQIYKKIMSLLIEELEKIISNNNNKNEKNYNYGYNTKNLNLNELSNINNFNSEIKNKTKLNVKEKEEQLKNNDDDNNNKKKDTNIVEKKIRKNKRSNLSVSSPNGVYNFEYGKNNDEPKFLENNYKTIFNNDENDIDIGN